MWDYLSDTETYYLPLDMEVELVDITGVLDPSVVQPPPSWNDMVLQRDYYAANIKQINTSIIDDIIARDYPDHFLGPLVNVQIDTCAADIPSRRYGKDIQTTAPFNKAPDTDKPSYRTRSKTKKARKASQKIRESDSTSPLQATPSLHFDGLTIDPRLLRDHPRYQSPPPTARRKGSIRDHVNEGSN